MEKPGKLNRQQPYGARTDYDDFVAGSNASLPNGGMGIRRPARSSPLLQG